MKKISFTILLAGISILTFSQEKETTLKKEIISVDIGFLGTWINYERHLKGLFTLKSQLGLEGGFGTSDIIGVNTYFAFIPTIRAEPRYYYNFNRRVIKEKKTLFNSADYFAVTVAYYPDLFIIANVPDLSFESGVYLIPKWGMQRTIGQRINFQFAFGAGVFFGKFNTGSSFGLDIRFGYNF